MLYWVLNEGEREGGKSKRKKTYIFSEDCVPSEPEVFNLISDTSLCLTLKYVPFFCCIQNGGSMLCTKQVLPQSKYTRQRETHVGLGLLMETQASQDLCCVSEGMLGRFRI